MPKPLHAIHVDRVVSTFMTGGVPVRRSPISLARRFFQICNAASAETLAAAGLTPLQFGTLVHLSRITGEPNIEQNSLAARLGIDRASTSQLVDELAEKRLVERRLSTADRRVRLLRLTAQGEKVRARLHPEQIARQRHALDSLTPEEREALLDLLVRVIQSNPSLARPGAGRRKRGSGQTITAS